MLKNIIVTISLLLSINSFSQCEGFTHTIDTYIPTCYGFADGAIYVYPSGATGTVYCDITDSDGENRNSDGAIIANILEAGWYYIRLEDGIGCIILDSVLLEDVGPFSLDYTSVEPSGTDLCDGSISIDTVYGYGGSYEDVFYFWTPDPDYISGTGATLMTDVCSGTYTVFINDVYGCSFNEEFIVDEYLSIIEQNKNDLITVNATNDIITLNNYSTDENLTISIFDIAGNLVQENLIFIGKNNIQVTFETGVYIYTIHSNREIIKTGKLSFTPI